MNEIVFVTHNKGKIAEAQKVLKNIKLALMQQRGVLSCTYEAGCTKGT